VRAVSRRQSCLDLDVPKAAQGIANRLMIASLALLTILGAPRDELERL
jgi:hypothetical protein